MKRVFAVAVCFVLGCAGKPVQLSQHGEAMVKRFESQMPQHQTSAFKQMCDEVERLRKEHKISQEEFDALHRVCGQAKEGQWDRAAANLEPLTKARAEKN